MLWRERFRAPRRLLPRPLVVVVVAVALVGVVVRTGVRRRSCPSAIGRSGEPARPHRFRSRGRRLRHPGRSARDPPTNSRSRASGPLQARRFPRRRHRFLPDLPPAMTVIRSLRLLRTLLSPAGGAPCRRSPPCRRPRPPPADPGEPASPFPVGTTTTTTTTSTTLSPRAAEATTLWISRAWVRSGGSSAAVPRAIYSRGSFCPRRGQFPPSRRPVAVKLAEAGTQIGTVRPPRLPRRRRRRMAGRVRRRRGGGGGGVRPSACGLWIGEERGWAGDRCRWRRPLTLSCTR